MKIHKLKIYKTKLYNCTVVYIAEFDDETVLAEIYKLGEDGCNGIRYASTIRSLIKALEEEFKMEIDLSYLSLLGNFNILNTFK